MKANDLLKQQHRDVERIFDRIEGGAEPIQELIEELADNLAAHALIEEQLFYPAAKAAADEKGVDVVMEALEEHAIAKIALMRLLETGIDEEPFKARVCLLKELVLNHVDEEEDELLPNAEKVLNDETLSALGVQMRDLFDDAMTKGHERVLGPKQAASRAEQRAAANGAARTASR